MNVSKLYHYQIGFPKRMRFPVVEGLVPSAHALREQASDRYGAFPMPDRYDPAEWQTIEIEVANGALHKIVARKALGDGRDVVMAFNVRDKVIRTCWINETTDTHRTLDASVYAKP